MRLGTLILTLGCALLLSGCANMNPLPEESEQLQHDAIARWKSCLKRHAGMPKSTQIHAAADEMHARCEGHRRDVLMSFPATFEPRLNTLLLEHTLRSAFRAPSDKTIDAPQTPINLPNSTTIQSAR